MGKVTTIIAIWQRRPSALRCNEVCAGLEYLGFTIRHGKKGNHRIVSHRGLQSFAGTNFDCGHGVNAIVKPVYIRKLLRILRENQNELEQIPG